MMSRKVLSVISFLCFILSPSLSWPQWVNFVDETSTRLGLAASDDLEKDMAAADLNQDGWEDIVIVRKVPFSNPGPRQDILLMNESGNLVDRTATLAPGFITNPTDSRDVFIGDLTGDGWPDVVIASTFGDQPRFYRNRGNNISGTWLGLVDETATRFPNPPVAVPGDVSVLQFCAVWAGDVTGNGAPDLYFSNYAMSGGTTDVLFINNGSGTFTNETTARLGDRANVSFGTGVEIRDVDNDGDNDIVKMSTLYSQPPFASGEFILYNNGSGVFSTNPIQTVSTAALYMFAIGDLNSDGKLDHYLVSDNQDRVALAQSATPDSSVNYNITTLSTSPRTTGFGGNTKVADIDSDGDLDIGVSPIDVDIANCNTGGEFALLQNRGDGTLSDPWPAADSQNFHIEPHDFVFTDVNNDSCKDIVMGLCTGWRVFVQNIPELAIDIIEPRVNAVVLPTGGAGRLLVRVRYTPSRLAPKKEDFQVRIGGAAATIVNGARVADEFWLSVIPPAVLTTTSDLEVRYRTCNQEVVDTETQVVAFGTPELADTVMVIDRSGSMRADRKMESAINAASVLVDTLRDEDRVAVVAFSGRQLDGYGRADEIFSIAKATDPITSVDNRGPTITQIQTLTAGSSTPIGQGLLRGLQELDEVVTPEVQNDRRVLVLLSDGMENVPNFWADPPFTWGPPSTPVRDTFDLPANREIEIYTISLGPDADHDLMRAISFGRGDKHLQVDVAPPPGGGAFFNLHQPNGIIPVAHSLSNLDDLPLPHRLANAYEHIHNKASNQLRLWQAKYTTKGSGDPVISDTRFLPQLNGGVFPAGMLLTPLSLSNSVTQLASTSYQQANLFLQAQTHVPSRHDQFSVPVENGLDFMTLTVNWIAPAKFAVNVIPPPGQDLAKIKRSTGPTNTVFRVSLPKPGNWTVQLSGPKGQQIMTTLSGISAEQGFARAVVGEKQVKINGRTVAVPTLSDPGEPVTIALSLFGQKPVLNAKVTAIAQSQANGQEEFNLVDDGNGADVIANDGIYTGKLTRTANGGVFSVEVLASWTGLEGMERNRIFPLAVVTKELDSDGDSISDQDEQRYGLDPEDPADAIADPDGDGLENWKEVTLGTDPHNKDTDGGGVNDGTEICSGTDPQNADDDGHASKDSDNDGMSDAWEKIHGLDPNDPSDAKNDPDRDGLSNLDEFKQCTSPKSADSDRDGMRDGEEVENGTDPTDPENRATPDDKDKDDNLLFWCILVTLLLVLLVVILLAWIWTLKNKNP